jgi:glycosyltransferase involved in cell wall biosynthesis
MPRPVRVMLATAATERGGAEVVIEHLAARLDPARYVPILGTPAGPLADRWRALGWTVRETPQVDRLRRVDQGALVVREIARILRDDDVDLVHTHGITAQIHTGLAARRARRPCVYHVHDLFDPRWSGDGFLHRLAARVPARAVIAISATVAASVRGRATGIVEIVPDGVDRDLASPAPEAPAGPLVVWCGRLQQWKGAHHFLEAARTVHAARPDARFAIVGGTLFGLEPTYQDALRLQVAAAGLAGVVTFAGHVADARPWLRAARVVVHSSDRPEPFGLVMAEAMMQERPVVAFRQGGAAEIVVDGETGRLVAPLDTEALGHAVTGLLGDEAEAARLGAAGRRRALTYFDADVMTAAVMNVYDRVSGAAA